MNEYSSKITLESGLLYERALRSFTRSDSASMPSSAFAKILRLDCSNLPPDAFATMRDGQALGFRHYPASSDRALVLVHGSACFGDQFHALATEVSRSHLAHVYTLNMRGHGFTPGERGHSVRHPGQVIEDVEDFVLFLKKNSPGAEVILGGHSAGGGVVLGFARSPAERLVSRYVFIAPFLGMGSPTVRPYCGGWIKRLDGSLIRLLVGSNLLGLTRFNDATVVEFGVDACGQDPRYAKTWSLNTALAFGPGPWVKNRVLLEKPTLLIAGDADECFFAHLYEHAFTQIASRVEQPLVGPIGHFDVLVDSEAIGAIARWLR